jgi:hypothetical protein
LYLNEGKTGNVVIKVARQPKDSRARKTNEEAAMKQNGKI